MKTARFVLAGLAAVMILLGDCTAIEARGRLFSRRAGGNCAPRAASVPCASCTATATSAGTPALTGVVCPVQQTPYYAGRTNEVDYYMFYAYPYPQCVGPPQPLYLPSGTPVGCNGGDHCFDPSRANTGPPNLGHMGHRLTEGQLKGFGHPFRQWRINFGSLGERNIDFYRLDIPKNAPGELRRPYEVWIGVENHLADPYGSPPLDYTVDDWNGYSYGRTVTFQNSSRPYYVLLYNPTPPTP